MRIVAGKYGGRVLEPPKNTKIRPTSDKVRGAIFNALQSRGLIDGAQVLDCFCGTGALGLEALSQGAAHCTFIDKNKQSLDLARSNAQALEARAVTFLLKDVTKAGARPDSMAPADLVFLDPPYEKQLLFPALSSLDEQGWLTEGAFVVAEVEKNLNFDSPSAFESVNEKTYGDTKVLFLGRKG